MRAEQRLGLRVIEEIREAIADADGNEVFLVGKRGDDGKVESVTVGARGNEEAVPVLSPHLEEGDVVIHNHPSGGITPERRGSRHRLPAGQPGHRLLHRGQRPRRNVRGGGARGGARDRAAGRGCAGGRPLPWRRPEQAVSPVRGTRQPGRHAAAGVPGVQRRRDLRG